jgi:hypothetical protein
MVDGVSLSLVSLRLAHAVFFKGPVEQGLDHGLLAYGFHHPEFVGEMSRHVLAVLSLLGNLISSEFRFRRFRHRHRRQGNLLLKMRVIRKNPGLRRTRYSPLQHVDRSPIDQRVMTRHHLSIILGGIMTRCISTIHGRSFVS